MARATVFPLVLASASPRRRELLDSVGLDFSVVVADVDESPVDGESPLAYVERVARTKCDAVTGKIDGRVLVVAADTTVEVDGVILGKPATGAEAWAMLSILSGRTHRVHTAVAAESPSGRGGLVVTTLVTFGQLSVEEIEWYIGLGESFDKAGGYGIQSAGAALVESIEGSPSNVIGIPLRETLHLIRRLG